jgi:hypothetical protein
MQTWKRESKNSFNPPMQAALKEVLSRLLETQEGQDRWLLENKDGIQAKLRRGIRATRLR